MGRLFGSDETLEMIKDALENGMLDHKYFTTDFFNIVDHDAEILFHKMKPVDEDTRFEVKQKIYYSLLKKLVPFVENSDSYNVKSRNGYFTCFFEGRYYDVTKKKCEWKEHEVLFEGEETTYKLKFNKEKNPRVKHANDLEETTEDLDRDKMINRKKVCNTLRILWSMSCGPEKIMAYVYSQILHPRYELDEEVYFARKSGVPKITAELLEGLTLGEVREMMEIHLYDFLGRKRFSEGFFDDLDIMLDKLDDSGKPVSSRKFGMTAKAITESNNKINKIIIPMWEEICLKSGATTKTIA